MTWSGVFPALTTPFDGTLEVDHTALGALIDRMVASGVHGLVLLGSLGENSSLSAAEKLGVLETGIAAAARRVPVLAGVAEASAREALASAHSASTAGADGIMLLPPVRYRGTAHETAAFVTDVARSSPLPIMVYNNPVAYGNDITPGMFAGLAALDSIVAIKESSGDTRRMTELRALTGERYDLFAGVDDLALEALLLGAGGWVAGLVCAFPEESVALFELARSGRHGDAQRLYRWFFPLLSLDSTPRFVHAIKLVQELTGLGSSRVRPPRLPLEARERAEIERIVREALAGRSAIAHLVDGRPRHAP